MDGHCSCLLGNRCILNDTYPDGQRLQQLYLFDTAAGRRVPPAGFHAPPNTRADGAATYILASTRRGVVILDSPHEDGRRIRLEDVVGGVG